MSATQISLCDYQVLEYVNVSFVCNRYVPYVADSKRAMDEYVSEIFLGGRNTISMHNTCEDSLLAAPIILDLVLLAELLTRIEVKTEGEKEFHGLHPVATLLSYLTKAPLVPEGKDYSLNQQM